MPYPTTGRPKGRPPKPAKPLPKHAYADTMQAYAGPTPPDFFEMSEYSLAAWRYLWANCPHLDEKMGDGVLVGLVALKLAEVGTIRHRLERIEMSYIGSNGQQAAVPEKRLLEAAEAQLTAWLAALGLSPADRARLNLNASRPTDTLADFRARNQLRALNEAKAVVHGIA